MARMAGKSGSHACSVQVAVLAFPKPPATCRDHRQPGIAIDHRLILIKTTPLIESTASG